MVNPNELREIAENDDWNDYEERIINQAADDIEALRNVEKAHLSHIKQLESELTRLREVIKGAPHHIECALTYRGPNGELSYCDEDLSLCDCWKRDALKEGK